jgi:hypothetical protein
MRDAKGVFGTLSGSALLQFLPITTPYSTVDGYGLKPIVDSMCIVMVLSDVRGDTTKVQKFDVYDVVEGPGLLHRDSIYYSSFPIDEHRGEKLFEFSHTGRRNVEARLFPTAAGKKYLDSIVNLSNWDDYTTDTLFLRKFHGFYITPTDGSPADAAVYSMDLANSGLELYVRNHDTIDISAIYDTVTTLFSFADVDTRDQTTGQVIIWNNVSINMPRFDYTGSALGAIEAETNGFTDTLRDSPTRETVYVQPMAGVGTYLRFTDELVDQIRNLRFKVDETTGQTVAKDIMINQALMTIWLEDGSTPVLDASISRLGSYFDLTRLVPIPDYQFQSERLTQLEENSSYKLPYNGYMNRSNGYYELDITSYVQQLAKQEGDSGYRNMQREVLLAPEAYSIFGFGESTLKGTGSDKPITIRITYTIIEG